MIDSLLRGEIERRKAQSDLDTKLAEIELKKREMELANLSSIHEERRKDRADALKLREQRKDWAAKARMNIRHNKQGALLQRAEGGCRVCLNQGEPSLTADEISWHHAGHPEEHRG